MNGQEVARLGLLREARIHINTRTIFYHSAVGLHIQGSNAKQPQCKAAKHAYAESFAITSVEVQRDRCVHMQIRTTTMHQTYSVVVYCAKLHCLIERILSMHRCSLCNTQCL